MRKHGWKLPHHPLQVVAVAVFLALGFAYYVFFAPFVGKKLLQYIAMGVYTPLIVCACGLYIWCAGADPADPGVFKSKKYVKILDKGKHAQPNKSPSARESTAALTRDADASTVGEKPIEEVLKSSVTKAITEGSVTEIIKGNETSPHSSGFVRLLAIFPCACLCNCSKTPEKSCDQQLSEDGMFYCSLCEVEIFKYSKHCRVCDKCVDRFDHHCRWLNNCVGRRNYLQFFILTVSSFLLRKQFSVEITSNLGSSFSLVPFVIVVIICTILAMIATLPVAQLLCFHILLIKKGMSTYDYIIALREQDQQAVGGQLSPQMSPASSLTVLSSASSFTTFRRGAWCTSPHLFLEDQFDVVPPDTGSVSSGKKTTGEEPSKKKNPKSVKISPWTLAQLNADEVSKAAAEARRKSKILQPVAGRKAPHSETGDSLGTSSRRMVPRPETNRRRPSKWVRLPADPSTEPLKLAYLKPDESSIDASTRLAPLQHEARNAFRTNQAMLSSAGIVYSPDNGLESPNIHPFRASSLRVEEGQHLTGSSAAVVTAMKAIPLSRSTSDGYEASGGEDSDTVPTRAVQRSRTWSNLFGPDQDAGTQS